MILKKKLIEVALPLEAINKASAREKSIRHGHPSTLHLWWARRPLAAARAVIFAQMVDDPSGHPDLFPTEAAQETERQRLFKIIEDLVQWESTTNEEVLERAREEIRMSWRRTCAENADHPRAKELFDPDKLPGFHDPFAGGGALPLEAQRLGLEAYASDLNPVAVLINKAMIEIPPKFAGMPPVNPEARANKELFGKQWKGAEGLAEDVRYYGKWMRDEAEKRIGHLYPKVEITDEMAKERPDLKPLVGQKLTVIAWIWARTVKSPNPAFASVDVPLVSNFILSAREGDEAFVEPVRTDNGYQFIVRRAKPESNASAGTKLARGANFSCLMSGAAIPSGYIYAEARLHRMGTRLMAAIALSDRGREYLSPSVEMEREATCADPAWLPDLLIPDNPRWFSPPMYGLTRFGDIFSRRQLAVLTALCDIARDAAERAMADAQKAMDSRDGVAGTIGSSSYVCDYADAIHVYLSFAIDKTAEGSTTLCTWSPLPTKLHVVSTFGRQAMPMTWDYAESNVLADSSGNILRMCKLVAEVLARQTHQGRPAGSSSQIDAAQLSLSSPRIVSTDPPYYDNIGYADLSDFFYVWLRRSLRERFPALFETLAVPKDDELVASPYRRGSKEAADSFFLEGMTRALERIARSAHAAFPVTIYYAFKQAESDDDDGVSSTGWDTFLQAVMKAGFAICGTWPVRTERSGGFRNKDQNALSTSIVLVCRPRDAQGVSVSRRDVIDALRRELPDALVTLQHSNVAPVDLAQAALGLAMSIYSRHERVLDAEGRPLTVREALTVINQMLDEVLIEQEGAFDADSRWALAWFEQHGFVEGDYGVAETLSKAKNTSVGGLVDADIVSSKRGKVRLLKPSEMPPDWDPASDTRLTIWEMVQHLVRVLEADGEPGAAVLAAKLGHSAGVARELCYRLYTVCERKKRAAEALSYNALVQSWPEIMRLARELPVDAASAAAPAPQTTMFDDGAKPKKKRTKGKN